jgi:hypothetical protein
LLENGAETMKLLGVKPDSALANMSENLARAAINGLAAKKPESKDHLFDEVYVQDKLAFEFGNEKEKLSDWVNALDDKLAAASLFAIKEIKSKKLYEWEPMIAAFNNCDQLIQEKDSHKKIAKTWEKSSQDFFKFDGSPNSSDVQALSNWFKDQIVSLDPKIYENSTLVQKGVVERLAKLAVQTGSKVDSFEHFFVNNTDERQKVLEISIVRFPYKDDPHVRVFRIVIFAWFHCTRILFAETNKAGFEVECDVMKFTLNPKIVAAVDKEFVDNAKAKLKDPKTFDF